MDEQEKKTEKRHQESSKNHTKHTILKYKNQSTIVAIYCNFVLLQALYVIIQINYHHMFKC